MENIEKLCEEFHEKIGKEKYLKIIVEEKAEPLPKGEYIEATFNLSGKIETVKPFMKIRENDKIVYSYIGNCMSNASRGF
jgi:hypothetical protein